MDFILKQVSTPAHIALFSVMNSYKGNMLVNTYYSNIYRQTYNIGRNKSQNLIASRLVLQLSLPNRLKPSVKSRMKM